MGKLIGIIGLLLLFAEFGFWNVVLFAIGVIVLLLIVAAAFPQQLQAPELKRRKRKPAISIKIKNSRTSPPAFSIVADDGPLGHIRTGLVIDEPWISKITKGEKTWEMRSTATRKRERIALIKKGTATIVGIATISDVLGPFNDSQITEFYSNHQVPTHMIGKWRYAWVLRDIKKLESPVNYVHKSGAVIFVTLDSAASQKASAADQAAA